MIDLREYGYEGPCEETAEGLLPARITEVHRELYRAVCARGEVWAALTGSFFHRAEERSDYPAVGDYVLLKHNECGNSGITAIFPRKSKFSRTDFSGHAAGYVKTVLEQVVAANFDYVFIMSSLNQDFNVSRIARYLSGAWQSGGVPVVILTKADLCEDPAAHVEAVREMAGGAEVIALSSRSDAGLERLQKYLAPGKTMVFLGMSGVGKSSLVNALAGEKLMSVRGIREDDSRGRHTTTHRQLIKLPTGAMLIDTPGMRELGLWEAGEGVSAAFADIEELISRCRFSDCTHKSEPGCAIREAIANGSLPEKQWQSYLTQKSEVAFVERKKKIDRMKRKKK